jgi:DNA repair protein RadD
MILSKVAEIVKRVCSDDGLYDYQLTMYHSIHNEWDAGHLNVLAVLPTGGGKTRILSAIIRDHNGASCTIAHRQELVSQISLAFARNGVRHRIIGPKKIIRAVVQLHMVEVGASYYDPNARASVAGVDTIMSWCGTGVDGDTYFEETPSGDKLLYGPRQNGYWGKPTKLDNDALKPHGVLTGKRPPKDVSDSIRRYAPTVTKWVTDEAHHLGAPGGKRNKWMKAVDLFPNALGLGVTATPVRADGAGLGRHHDGVFDTMITGPTMRWLIDRDRLSEYRIFAPPSDLSGRMGEVKVSTTTGDFNVNQVRNAVEQSNLIVADDKTSKVVGDVVQTYLMKFNGMLSVVFVPSVTAAEELERQFISAGVAAKSLNGNTPDEIRINSIRKLARRELLVLINVALFDEGFDLPAIEVIQDAYPTQSYGLFCQRFGRMLRKMGGKQFGIYSDHAGNVMRHGLPDAKREWTLDRREKRKNSDDVEQLRTCVDHKIGGVVVREGCFGVYERYLKECPQCGLHVPKPTPAERTGPEYVDGDLFELDAETLARMRGDIARVDQPMDEAVAEYRNKLINAHAPTIGVMANTKRFAIKHEAQQQAVESLREIMAMWAGYHRAANRNDDEIFRRFYLAYSVDWLTAQALPTDKMLKLGERVALDIGEI